MADKREKGTRRGAPKAAAMPSPGQAKAFGQKNLILFLLALALIMTGHIALGMGSITFAPVCLVLGYCVMVPVAIIV